MPGFPELIATREQLAQIVQWIIWIGGPQHAAVNFPQVGFTTFISNAVGAAYTPPVQGNDRGPGEGQLCPGRDHYDQLLDYDLNSEDGSQAIVEKYYRQLITEVRETIVARNQQRSGQKGLLAYPYFLPENIPNSTSV